MDLDQLAKDWLSPIVARSAIEKFTKGLYKASTMNTYDAAGKGIKRRLQLHSKIAYLKEDVINWLKERVKK